MEEKKKKKKYQSVVLVEEQTESQTFLQVVRALEELERQGVYVDLQVCPRCKSPKVRRVTTMGGDLWGHMGIIPPKFECKECGWRARLVLKVTNRPMSVKDVEIIAEANNCPQSR